MSDFEQLLLILGVVYLCECVWHTGPYALLITTVRPRRSVFQSFSVKPRLNHGGFGLAGILPFGVTFVCEPWPISVSPQAICAIDPRRGGGAVRPMALDEIHSISAMDHSIIINQSVFAKTSTRVMANDLAIFLRRLQACDIDGRAAMIQHELAKTLDSCSVQARLDSTVARLGVLRAAATVLFILLFALLPVACRWLSWPASLWWLVPCCVLFWVVVVGLFRRCGRGIFPAARSGLRGQTLMMAFAPTVAMRAGHILSRELLAVFHPIAVAWVFCSESVFLSMAQRMLREARYPIMLTDGDSGDTANQTHGWFNECWSDRLEQFLQDLGYDIAEMLGPPICDSADAVAYCPRCQSQFTDIHARCVHCGDRSLIVL